MITDEFLIIQGGIVFLPVYHFTTVKQYLSFKNLLSWQDKKFY